MDADKLFRPKGNQNITNHTHLPMHIRKQNRSDPQIITLNNRINERVLSPTLFNIYISDIPLPPKNIQITTYPNNITITASHTKHRKAQPLIQPYLQKIYEWATINNLHIDTDKTTTTLFTPDPAEYSTTLSLKLNNQTLPTTKHPKILGSLLTQN